VSVDVTNTGSRDGDEVVQFYVKHLGSKVERPIAELRGFVRVNIPRGEKRTVTVPLKAESLGYWDDAHARFTVESEQLQILAGPSSASLPVQQTIRVAD
jgi:beta-glucosidase